MRVVDVRQEGRRGWRVRVEYEQRVSWSRRLLARFGVGEIPVTYNEFSSDHIAMEWRDSETGWRANFDTECRLEEAVNRHKFMGTMEVLR